MSRHYARNKENSYDVGFHEGAYYGLCDALHILTGISGVTRHDTIAFYPTVITAN